MRESNSVVIHMTRPIFEPGLSRLLYAYSSLTATLIYLVTASTHAHAR